MLFLISSFLWAKKTLNFAYDLNQNKTVRTIFLYLMGYCGEFSQRYTNVLLVSVACHWSEILQKNVAVSNNLLRSNNVIISSSMWFVKWLISMVFRFRRRITWIVCWNWFIAKHENIFAWRYWEKLIHGSSFLLNIFQFLPKGVKMSDKKKCLAKNLHKII